MRIFPKMNTKTKEPCPICKTKKQKPVVLILKAGSQEGFTAEAIQVHVDCLDLWIQEDIIFQRIKERDKK